MTKNYLSLFFLFSIANCNSQNQCTGDPKFPSTIGGFASGLSTTSPHPSCQSENGAQDSSGYNGLITFYIYGIGSWDTNLIVSQRGFETPKRVSVEDNLGINIYFENDLKVYYQNPEFSIFQSDATKRFL